MIYKNCEFCNVPFPTNNEEETACLEHRHLKMFRTVFGDPKITKYPDFPIMTGTEWANQEIEERKYLLYPIIAERSG